MRVIGILFGLALIVAQPAFTHAGDEDPQFDSYAGLLREAMHAGKREALNAETRRFYGQVTVRMKLIGVATDNNPMRVVLARDIQNWCLWTRALEMANRDYLNWGMPLLDAPLIRGICGIPAPSIPSTSR